MSGQIISEYISKEHQQLLTLFRKYNKHENSSSTEALQAFHELTKALQQHVARDEEAIFPLLEKVVTILFKETDLLKKEHQAICELLATILQKQEEGNYAREEEEALHALLSNHIKSEQSVLAVLDSQLNERERESAIENAQKILRG